MAATFAPAGAEAAEAGCAWVSGLADAPVAVVRGIKLGRKEAPAGLPAEKKKEVSRNHVLVSAAGGGRLAVEHLSRAAKSLVVRAGGARTVLLGKGETATLAVGDALALHSACPQVLVLRVVADPHAQAEGGYAVAQGAAADGGDDVNGDSGWVTVQKKPRHDPPVAAGAPAALAATLLPQKEQVPPTAPFLQPSALVAIAGGEYEEYEVGLDEFTEEEKAKYDADCKAREAIGFPMPKPVKKRKRLKKQEVAGGAATRTTEIAPAAASARAAAAPAAVRAASAAASRPTAARAPVASTPTASQRTTIVNKADTTASGLRSNAYIPAKLRPGEAPPHVSLCVETETLACVEPPDLYNESTDALGIFDMKAEAKHKLHDVCNSGRLSALQLETVVYSNRRFNGPRLHHNDARAGFFLGDGAGVGKGRQLAAVALEHWRRGGRRILWISVSNDLRYDAARDLADLCGKRGVIPIYPQGYSVLPGGKLSRSRITDGILFVTYSLLVSGGGKEGGGEGRGRFSQILQWLKEDRGDPLLMFDEGHKAKQFLEEEGKKAKSSKTALAVVELQNKLPSAKVIYASATGASEAANLGYMCRMNTFGYADMRAFATAIQKRGVGALELNATGMKAAGAYVCRSLSYEGAEFKLDRIAIDKKATEVYDHSSEFVTLVLRVLEQADLVSMPARDEWADLVAMEKHQKTQIMSTQLWSGLLRFFKSMLMAAKVPKLAQWSLQAAQQGYQVVIGLQSTGEAATKRAQDEAEGNLEEIVSAPQACLEILLKAFPEHVQPEMQQGTLNKLDKLLHAVHEAVAAWERAAGLRPAEGAEDEDDEDAIQIERVMTVDEIEQEKLEMAARSGELVILDDDSCDEEMEDAAVAGDDKADGSDSDCVIISEDEARDRPVLPAGQDVDDALLGDELEARGGGGTAGDGTAPPVEQKPQIAEKEREPQIASGKAGRKPLLHVKGKGKQAIKKANADGGASTDDDGDDSEGEDASRDEEDRLAELGLVRDDRLAEIKSLLFRGLRCLKDLPANPLDDLIDKLGGPGAVAEMTGRKQRMVRRANGTGFALLSRMEGAGRTEGGMKDVNLHEKDAFMAGSKNIAIISEAASTGISLHADGRFQSSNRRRMHFTLELPWSAQAAVQQFGRSHRSNQQSAPIYRLLCTNCSGETRFAASAAKKLSTLGAILKGDRRAMGAGVALAEFDVETSYGKEAVDKLIRSVATAQPALAGQTPPAVQARTALAPEGDKEEFFAYARRVLCVMGILEKKVTGSGERFQSKLKGKKMEVKTFLNRLLILPVADQGTIFRYFEDTLDGLVAFARVMGELSSGIDEIEGTCVAPAPFPLGIHDDDETGTTTTVLKLDVDTGISFDEAVRQLEEHMALCKERSVDTSNCGFWISETARGFGSKGWQRVWLVRRQLPKTRFEANSRAEYSLFTPEGSVDRDVKLGGGKLGPWPRDSKRLGVSKKGSLSARRVSRADARALWCDWYEHGARVEERFLVSGAVLPIFKALSALMLACDDSLLKAPPRRKHADGTPEDPKEFKARSADDAALREEEEEEEEARGHYPDLADSEDAAMKKKKQRAEEIRSKNLVTLKRASAKFLATGETRKVIGVEVPHAVLDVTLGKLLDDVGCDTSTRLPAATEAVLKARGDTVWELLGVHEPTEEELLHDRDNDDEGRR